MNVQDNGLPDPHEIMQVWVSFAPPSHCSEHTAVLSQVQCICLVQDNHGMLISAIIPNTCQICSTQISLPVIIINKMS